ncbi:MAG: c-type cytochrome [Acidobacteria bacterium]|nr:c-type cytochrome [Acidobacteriota bacterium]
MTKTVTALMATCALLAAAAGVHNVLYAQAASTSGGVYTDAQAQRGAALYKEQCAACHGEDLKGNDIIPGLAGQGFTGNWQGKSLGDLYDKIQMTMPALNPGSLTPEQTADLIAHILSTSKYPAGTTDLAAKAEALQQIKIDAAKN